LTKKNEFTSSIVGLADMWGRMQAGALSRKDDTVTELQQQRRELVQQARVREKQLTDINNAIRQRQVFAGATFN